MIRIIIIPKSINGNSNNDNNKYFNDNNKDKAYD